MPSDLALNCRNLCHKYYYLMDNRSAYVNKLQGELRMAFPQYLGIFSGHGVVMHDLFAGVIDSNSGHWNKPGQYNDKSQHNKKNDECRR